MSDDNEELGIIGGIKFLPEHVEVANSINETIGMKGGLISISETLL